MRNQQVHQGLVKELCRNRSNELLQKYVAAIEDLTQELEREAKINEEQKQLIRIIQEGKEYYENQCRNNPYEQQCHQLTAEVAQLTHALNGQRSANHQLQERVHSLQEKLIAKDKEAEQLKEEKREYVQSIEAMCLQKEILQKEWNRAVKAVKRKIEKIVSQDNPETKHITINKKYELPLQTRQSDHSDDSQRRADLRTRTQNILQNLQKMEAIQQFEGIFLHTASGKKHAQSLSSSQQGRRALREVSQNEC